MADCPTLSITQACVLVGVSRRTIYNWLNSHKLEYVRTAGGAVRIYTDSLWRPGTPGVAQRAAPQRPVVPKRT